MIAICIPVFNRDVRPLVHDLLKLAEACTKRVGVVCLDDGSDSSYRQLNRELSSCCTYEELPENVGRSRIRNLFRERVPHDCEYMIFVDCDLKVSDPLFLCRYLDAFEQHPQVVVGGHTYPAGAPSKEYHLHFANGVARVSKSAAERSLHPNRSFMTGNFAIRKDLFMEVPFDEAIVGYGHEDTLMGYRLQQRGIAITHIENPLLADELDTNSLFLEKTRVSVSNLVAISNRLNDAQFDHQVTLLRHGRRIQRLHLASLLLWVFGHVRGRLESSLQSGNAGTKAFLFYKLGLFLTEDFALRSTQTISRRKN